ncbi:MAG TPA: M14 family zinc carboxypeptidase [Sphingobacteriaceae bacterium]
MSNISSMISAYSSFEETRLKDRFFKWKDLEPIIHSKTNFEIAEAGRSAEGRSIYLLKRGSGPVRIFLWSQMHGDEATGTMALFDLFNFLDHRDHHRVTRHILERCTLYFLPMVNPDGAERFTRVNAQGLDINRDYLRQQSPEGRLLKQLRDEICPDFGFNLHDKNVLWSAGNTGNPATISLLAPAFDARVSVNPVRKKAMQVIAGINKAIQPMIPDHVGLFNDEYEPRAFGDNFQAAGTSTILIEAGGYQNDREKQFIRKVYFAAILSGLIQISEGSYTETPLTDYTIIPQNRKVHFSILLKNCLLEFNGKEFLADIGLNADELIQEAGKSIVCDYILEDLGDLSGRFGYEEYDVSGCRAIFSRAPEVSKAADFALMDGLETILSFENGRIRMKTSNLSGERFRR